MTLPEGFAPHFRKSPLTDPWEPLFSKREEYQVRLGLRADTQHCNSRGFVHGGLISALADNAMGLSCVGEHNTVAGLATVSLHIDYVTVARMGNWIEFDTHFVKAGRSIDTAQGRVLADGKVCALCSASFKVLENG